MRNIRIIIISTFCLMAAATQAETVYVIDELKIGLHENPTINSPITKLVPSGTELSVIERSDDLVHVKEPEGTSGWINNKYLVADRPGKAHVLELEKQIETLKSAATNTTQQSEIPDSQKDLVQQLKSERLKSGELEASLADIKAKIANVDNSNQFLGDIEELKQENEQLRSQLESSGIEVEAETTSSNIMSLHGWQQYLTAFIIILIIGMVVGAFILDYIGRRRHGGFRI